jgi:hypothetical protein
VHVLASRYLAFVRHAFVEETGHFRNFLSYSHNWLEDRGSQDSHGRALWALGTMIGRSADPGRRSLGGLLFHRALRAVNEFSSPRACAYALLGIDEYLRAFQGESGVQSVGRLLADKLLDWFGGENLPDWPWFEDKLTYCNARLPQALIASGAWLKNDDMVAVGLKSLEWLVGLQRSADGYFAPIGSNGFYLRGKERARFDQQPVEACATVSACLEARRVTSDARWLMHARHAFGWFLGQNERQQMIYDAATGGCRDGLHFDRVNENQGAESTLSFLLALLEMRSTDRLSVTASRDPAPDPQLRTELREGTA